MESLISFLQKHSHLIPPQGTKYLKKLQQSSGKSPAAVYTILHHTSVGLDSVQDDDEFLDSVNLCVECLKYLTDLSPDLGSVPEGGLEKLAYHLIKKTESRRIAEISHTISDCLLTLSHCQKCNKQVLYYAALKLMSLKSKTTKCTCHEGHCDLLVVVSCQINGVLLSALSENELPFSQLFCTFMNWCVPHISEQHCACHLHNLAQAICTVGKKLEQHCAETNRKSKRKEVDCATKVVSNFLRLFAALGRSNSGCTIQCDQTVQSMYLGLYDSFAEISIALSIYGHPDQEMIRKVACQLYNEIIKHLPNTKHAHTNLQCSKLFPLLAKMLQLGVFKQSQVVNGDILSRTVFCLYQLLQQQANVELKKQAINCALNVVEPVTESMQHFGPTTTDFLLDCLMNIVIFVVKSKTEELLLEVIPLCVKCVNMSCTLKSSKKLCRITSLLCSIHRQLNRPREGMKVAAQSVSVITSSDHETRDLVDDWMRCKLAWLSQVPSSNTAKRHTIAEDLPAQVQSSSVLHALFHELDIARSFRQQPPYEEFYVLHKLVELSEKASVEMVHACALLSHLLFSWSSVFNYASSALALSTSALTMVGVMKVDWELMLLAKFVQFLCTWESDLAKVWKTRRHGGFSNSDPFSHLKWDPGVHPFPCSKLYAIVEACRAVVAEGKVVMKYPGETIQALRVIAVVLELRGNVTHALQTYNLIVELLRATVNKEKVDNDPSMVANLVATQCKMAKILLQFGFSSAALKLAREALKTAGGLERYVSQTNARPEKIQKLKQQMSMDSQCAMLQVFIALEKISEATELMNEIVNSEFIDAEHRKTSHASTVAAARVQLLMSDMCVAAVGHQKGPFDDRHLLSEAMQGMQLIAMVLDQSIPGSLAMFQMFESNQNSAIPKFGQKTKEMASDLLRQFELLLDLVNGLHRVASLWMSIGSLKTAFYKIIEGILLTRHCLLPERELQFQLLLARCVQMERDKPRLEEELAICNDILSYVAQPDLPRQKRHKLFSTSATNEEIENEELEAALNNSSVMESLHDDNPDSEQDDPDGVPVSTVPVDMKTKLFTKEIAVMSSPMLSKKRKAVPAGREPVFQHDTECECALCSNFLLTKQQCQLAVLTAEHLEPEESIRILENAATFIPAKGRWFMHNIQQSLSKFAPNASEDKTALLSEELQVMGCLARLHHNVGHNKSATALAKAALRKIAGLPIDVRDFHVVADINLTAGKLLLEAAPDPHPEPTVDSNKVIDQLAKFNSSRESDLAAEVGEKMKNLVLQNRKNAKTLPEKPVDAAPKAAPAVGVDFPQFNTPTRAAPKQRRAKPTPSINEYKTPQVKSGRGQAAPRSVKTSTKKAQASKTQQTSKKFTIFDDTTVPDVTLSTKTTRTVKKTKGKLPVPNISDSEGDTEWLPESKSTAKKKSTRRVIFSPSSDESDGNAPVVKVSESSPFVTTRRTRAKTSATKNVMKARKSARRRHRAEEGPVYTDEEQETDRPTRKATTTRKARLGAATDETPSGKDFTTDEIEHVRESTVRGLSPLRNSLADLHIEDLPSADVVPDFDLFTCEEHLTTALEKSTACGDFYSSKQAAQHLALHYQRAPVKSRDAFRVAACHALSIGVTLRWLFNMNLKLRQKSAQRAKKNASTVEKTPEEAMYETFMANADERTRPDHVIRSFHQSRSFVEASCSKLPSDWTVCLMSTVREGGHNHLLVTRMRRDRPPLHLQIDGSKVPSLMDEFRGILKGHIDGLKCKDKSLWWTQQRNVDRTLGQFVAKIGTEILGEHRGVTLGCVIGDAEQRQVERSVDVVAALADGADRRPSYVDRDLIEIFLSAWSTFSVEEKIKAASRLVGSDHVIETIVAFEEQSLLLKPDAKRGHVVMILDKELQALPWESVPLMRNHSVSRMPSVEILSWQLDLATLPRRTEADLRVAAYVLNPKGDLSNTENRFADWFRSIQSWDGTTSRAPTRDTCFSYLAEKDVFIYIGHGSGSLYIPRELLPRKSSRASALLMGCKSGQLSEPGVTEPEGMPLAYLMSGSPCVLSCLWIVTDKDIDKYLVKCVTSWMEEGANLTDVVRPSARACKMPNMNGAACVVYGLPVRCARCPDEWARNMPQELQGL